MDLSRIAIEPRLRNGWEAIDLGVAMTRAWWWPLQLSWLVPSALVYLISSILLPDPAWLSLLITWWLAPFWDRFPLMLASRALFSEKLNAWQALLAWKSILRTDWFAWLTWRRLSPTRSFDMPVSVLEALRGDMRSRRLQVLHRTSSSAALALSFVSFCMIAVLALSFWIIAIMMVPQGVDTQPIEDMFSAGGWWSRGAATAVFFAMALVAPFYSIAGFALYISRRIELEGWDIEIRFRHLADRIEKTRTGSKTNHRAASFLLPFAFCLILFASANPTTGFAQETDSADPTSAELERSEGEEAINQLPAAARTAKRAIIEVLEGEDFHRMEQSSGWRLKREERDGDLTWIAKLLDLLESIYRTFEPIFEFIGYIFSTIPYLLWILVIGGITYLIYRFRDALSSVLGMTATRVEERERPDVLFGLDLRKESLPDDVPKQVMVLWRNGEHRDAIGLLYRATLSGLIHQHRFEFYDGYTEQECADIVRAGDNRNLSAYLQSLTQVWQHLAYGHRLPTEEKVADLCKGWPQFFESTAPSNSSTQGAAA